MTRRMTASRTSQATFSGTLFQIMAHSMEVVTTMLFVVDFGRCRLSDFFAHGMEPMLRMDEIRSHHFEAMGDHCLWKKKGISTPGFLRWCRISSIHSSMEVVTTMLLVVALGRTAAEWNEHPPIQRGELRDPQMA